MSGFVRRYSFQPGNEIITQIEGAIIVDLPPPGSIQGVGSGVVDVVGEFSNMTYAVRIATDGTVTTNPQPIEIFSSQDLLDKVGGWDALLGDFGGDNGNGFVEIRNKRFYRLIVSPVDLITPAAGTQGTIRMWRQLPTNQSATVAQPIVPLSAAQVGPSREFTTGSVKCRVASNVVFFNDLAYTSGVDGAITAAGAAVVQDFVAAGGDFVNRGVATGDMLVLGVISGAGALGANADTYRVVSVTNATTLVVQKLAGSSWTWTSGTAQPWRLHVQRTADSTDAGVVLASTSGYRVLVRPLTATIAAATALSPVVVPATATADTWDTLSGLTAIVHPTQAITYTADIHAANAASSAAMSARYTSAIDALLNDAYPARDINIVVAARKTSTIRTKLKSHVYVASERGLTRRTIISPPVDMVTLTTVLSDTDPGVGANRGDRIDFSWPGAQTTIPEAVDYVITVADGSTTTDGVLDVTGDTWLAAVESNLPPERNPGQATQPVPAVMAPVIAFGRGTPVLGMPEYTAMRAAGICGLRFDRTAGPIFQSGVTTSLVSGEKNIMRRRMADFIQDSIAQRTVGLSKQPQTRQWSDSVTAEIVAFLDSLLSPDNPSAQRIYGYEVDDRSGNTATTKAAGIFVEIVTVQLTPTADFIVIQTNIGEGVVLSTTATTAGALAT